MLTAVFHFSGYYKYISIVSYYINLICCNGSFQCHLRKKRKKRQKSAKTNLQRKNKELNKELNQQSSRNKLYSESTSFKRPSFHPELGEGRPGVVEERISHRKLKQKSKKNTEIPNMQQSQEPTGV